MEMGRPCRQNEQSKMGTQDLKLDTLQQQTEERKKKEKMERRAEKDWSQLANQGKTQEVMGGDYGNNRLEIKNRI
ncbi:hypothetical protein M8J77_020801 [Diaphorina citri]|nr:hypothetical protein M8J77_020801 [Diaphorina citri]